MGTYEPIPMLVNKKKKIQMMVNAPNKSRNDLIKPLLIAHRSPLKLRYLQLLFSAFLRGRAAPRLAL